MQKYRFYLACCQRVHVLTFEEMTYLRVRVVSVSVYRVRIRAS